MIATDTDTTTSATAEAAVTDHVRAAAAGVDLQLSGHTHGGQIWPFQLIVRAEQGALQGLSRHGEHTQLYTTRGAGFWGPPFRVFAPNEISLLTLRSGTASQE